MGERLHCRVREADGKEELYVHTHTHLPLYWQKISPWEIRYKVAAFAAA